jgi:hypothetical protein
MKAQFYICMTSGTKGPEAQLTEELSKEIIDLALQLNKPWIGSKLATMGLFGSDHYIVVWEDKAAPVLGLRTLSSGYVSMWKQGDTDWHVYQDTVGLWARLAPTGSQAYQKWCEDINKAMDEYEKNSPDIFGINKP